MSRIHTHYDNLKVARNAPPEVIQAAYRALSLKHHPDHNPGDPEAERIMALINAAYEVLSDPVKRADHDAWIRRREAEEAKLTAANAAAQTSAQSTETTAQASARSASQTWTRPEPPGGPAGAQASDPADAHGAGSSFGGAAGTASGMRANAASRGKRKGVFAHVRRNWLYYLAAAALVWRLGPWSAPKDFSPPQPSQPERPTAKVSRRPASKHARTPDASDVAAGLAAAAANASAEDAQTAGSHAAGRASSVNRCRVVLDNRHGPAALVARLVRLDGSVATREFTVPARGSMTVRDVPPGAYEVRYRNPATGETRKTEPFTLREAQGDDGQLHSDVLTLTTYDVPGGNMRTAPMGEGEF